MGWAIFTATLWVAIASPAGFGQDAIPPKAELDQDNLAALLSGPEFERAMQAAEQALERLSERRGSPAAKQERVESRTAYEELSAGQALVLAKHIHPEAITETSWDPLSSSTGEVERYVGDYAAVIDEPGQPSDSLVESTTPMLVPTESGELAPVDHSLLQSPGSIEEKNPLAPVDMANAVSEGVLFSDIGVGVSPAGAAGSATAQLARDTAFFANAYRATDYLVRPALGGVEVSYQLRSASSPETFRLDFALPAGAHLQAGDGEIEIVSGSDEILARIAEPATWDADGWEVPVSYRVEGDTVVLAVDHRGRDLRYPLIVDPTIVEDQFYWNGWAAWYSGRYAPDFLGWGEYVYPEQVRGTHFTNYVWDDHCFCGAGDWGRGLYTQGQQGAWYYADSSGAWNAAWVFNSPGPRAFIYRGTFAWIRNLTSDVYDRLGQLYRVQSWLTTGMSDILAGGPWGGASLWNFGSSYNNAEGSWTWSPRTIGGDHDYYYDILHCLGANCGDSGVPEQARGNSMLFMTYFSSGAGGWEQAQENFASYLGGAEVYIGDDEPPEMGAAQHFKDGRSWDPNGANWVDNAQFSVVTQAQDLGLGVKEFKLVVPRYTDKIRTHACSGDRFDRCPILQWTRSDDARVTGDSFTYSSSAMSEGRNTVQASAKDVVGNWSANQNWDVKVDRSPPVIALSGSLKQAADSGQTLDQESYQLIVDATDGSTSSALQERSGVKLIEIQVDGVPQHFSPEQSCPQGSCSLRDTWTFENDDYAEGQHTVTAIAEDQLGHQSQQSFTFTTSHSFDSDEDQEPMIVAQPGPALPDGSYQLLVSSTDVGGSGVVHTEVYVDGVLLQQFDQECPDGGCSMVRTMQMTGGQSPSEHEIAIFSEDRAGNEEGVFLGKAKTRPPLFGYADNFENRPPEPSGELGRGLGLAVEGGADVIRFTIDWCDIAQFKDPNDPSSWAWEKYDPIFNAIHGYNTDVNENGSDNPLNDIKVIAVLADSPEWASNLGGCGDPTAPPAPEHEDDWATFVRGVLDHWGQDPEFGLYAVEAWNEPNLPQFWAEPTNQPFDPEPERWARLVNLAYEQVANFNNETGRAIIPVPGGMAAQADPGDFLRAALDQQIDDPNTPVAEHVLPEAMQKLSVHLYANFKRHENKAAREIRDIYDANVNAVLEQLGSVPAVWITEIGFPSHEGPHAASNSTEKTQRKRLLAAYFRYSAHLHVEAFLVYRLIDELEGGLREPERFGVVEAEPSYKPKAAYCRLAERVETDAEPLNPQGC